jgi:hypothetical protein
MVWLANRLNIVDLERIRASLVYLFERYVRGIGSIIPVAKTFYGGGRDWNDGLVGHVEKG